MKKISGKNRNFQLKKTKEGITKRSKANKIKKYINSDEFKRNFDEEKHKVNVAARKERMEQAVIKTFEMCNRYLKSNEVEKLVNEKKHNDTILNKTISTIKTEETEKV